MGNDLQNWFMTYQWLELIWNTCLWELYIFEMFSSIFEWIRCFLLCFLETKCKLIIISFWLCEIHLCSFISHCCILKHVVLISLGIESLKSLFIAFEAYLFYTSTIIIFSFSILCLRTSKILVWGELISAIFQLIFGLKC